MARATAEAFDDEDLGALQPTQPCWGRSIVCRVLDDPCPDEMVQNENRRLEKREACSGDDPRAVQSQEADDGKSCACGTACSDSVAADHSSGTIDGNGKRNDQYCRLDRTCFFRLGLATLSVQTIVTAVFSWYSWYRKNFLIGMSTFFILQPWFLFICWKACFPYSENFLVWRLSALVCMFSTSGIAPGYDWMIGSVFLCLAGVFSLDVAARCLYKTVPHPSDRRSIVVPSILSSLKAFLICIYLQAEVMSEVGASTAEDSFGAIFEVVEAIENESTVTYQEMDDALSSIAILRSTFTGGTLNLLLLSSFVFEHVAHLSFTSVVTLRISISEAVVVVAQSLLVLATIILLGLVAKPSIFKAYYPLMTTLWVSSICAILACGLISRSVLKERHPFFRERNSRQSFSLDWQDQVTFPH